jgi:hypothetical protein
MIRTNSKTGFKNGALLGALLLLGSLHTPAAHAEAYFGIEGGVGSASGTFAEMNSGLVLGATAGYQLMPEFGVGLTYQHSALGISGLGTDVSVSQILAEANVFSLLLLHGGLHVGDVVTSIAGTSSSDLGLGVHLGFDIRVTEKLSAGFGAYWTYVTASNDKHSLFNFVVPLKIWF